MACRRMSTILKALRLGHSTGVEASGTMDNGEVNPRGPRLLRLPRSGGIAARHSALVRRRPHADASRRTRGEPSQILNNSIWLPKGPRSLTYVRAAAVSSTSGSRRHGRLFMRQIPQTDQPRRVRRSSAHVVASLPDLFGATMCHTDPGRRRAGIPWAVNFASASMEALRISFAQSTRAVAPPWATRRAFVIRATENRLSVMQICMGG